MRVFIYFFCALTFHNLMGYNDSLTLYRAGQGDIEHVLRQYLDEFQAAGEPDRELIRQLAYIILDQGFKCQDRDANLLALFGASIAQDEKAEYILEDGLQRNDPLFQIIALNYFARIQNEKTDSAFAIALKSPFLPVRFEALYNMAEQKYPRVSSQILNLMQKLPADAHPIFPKLFALSGDEESIKILQKMIADAKEEAMRLEAINATAFFGRDDLLPVIRKNASHINIAEKEACLLALGQLSDHSSLSLIRKERSSRHPNVRLAALKALKLLGAEDVRDEAHSLARTGDLFAISFLGEMPGSEDFLKTLLNSSDIHIRFNACLALLELKSSDCLPYLAEILFGNGRDISLTRIASPGKSLFAWKVIPSFSRKIAENPVVYELHLNMLENILIKIGELPEADFIQLAHAILDTEQKHLIPQLIRLLEKLKTKDAIRLLKYHSQKIGSPFVRNWCNLALYRLKEEGHYLNLLKSWVSDHKHHPLIKFRPLIPWDQRGFENPENYKYRLTPQETSRLLIEVLEALVENRDDESIKILLRTIKEGNRQNRHTIAGLLLRL